MTVSTDSANSISPQSLRPLLAIEPKPVLIDVRTPGEFAGVHAVGARSIPLDTLNADAIRTEFGDSRIYVLCQSGARAKQACDRLRSAGVSGAILVDGGTTAWIAAGLPVERGTGSAISMERQVRIAAGLLVVLGVALGWLVHPALLLLAGSVGGGLIFSGITNTCGMARVLAIFPWNRS